ncbi:MAG: winged helix-turn-helix domain-containing protein [Candidatus Woesearchaeota archaeon]|nr:winged helix-turn-helix domain-containing protein [Candidatus Woesearchaeota archaeon]
MTDPFMLVSLKDAEAKNLSRVIASDSCRKILNFLTEKDATESEIAKALKMPLSTAHHNVQQLLKAKMIVVDEFHYSEKGREVNHYKLANKYIIIAPQGQKTSFWEHMKKYVPVTLLTLGTAAVFKSLHWFTPAQFSKTLAVERTKSIADEAVHSADIAIESTGEVAGMSMDAAADAVMQEEVANVANVAEPIQQEIVHVIEQPWWLSPVIDWVVLGAFTVIVLIVLIEFIRWKSTTK